MHEPILCNFYYYLHHCIETSFTKCFVQLQSLLTILLTIQTIVNLNYLYIHSSLQGNYQYNYTTNLLPLLSKLKKPYHKQLISMQISVSIKHSILEIVFPILGASKKSTQIKKIERLKETRESAYVYLTTFLAFHLQN